MSFLKNIVRNAVNDGISKGIRDAVSKAAESIVAPKAEAYANKVADSLDEAAKGMDGAAAEVNAVPESEKKNAFAALEASLNKLTQAAEKATETIEATSASRENLAAQWGKKLSGFPVWCFGGTEFWFEETGKTADGNPYYNFNAQNATQEGLDLYVELLKKDGFVRKYPGSDEVLYKDLGGEYLIFGKTDAFGCAPTMSVSMVRTKDKSEIEM